MDTGDAVLLPRGGTHDVVSQPDLACRDVTAFTTSTICHGVSALTACKVGECPSSHVLIFSGCMEFDLGGMGSLIGLMPEAMFVGTLSERYPEILPILDAMERETCGGRAGFAGILAHLANVVAAFIVRAWVESGCGEASGWVSALRDPRLGGVISAVHRNPGRDWTVADLAAEMGSSRSIFAERFLAVTGLTPITLPDRTPYASRRGVDRPRPHADRCCRSPSWLRLAGRLQPSLQANHWPVARIDSLCVEVGVSSEAERKASSSLERRGVVVAVAGLFSVSCSTRPCRARQTRDCSTEREVFD